MRIIRASSLFAMLLVVASLSCAQDSAESRDSFFEEQVRPILEENCLKCHGGRSKIKGEFDMSTREGLLTGGELGEVVDLEAPADSLYLEMLSYKDEEHEMPPDGQLDRELIDTLTDWLNRGVPWTEGEAGTLHYYGEDDEEDDGPRIVRGTASHWSYQAVTRPEAPEVDNFMWRSHSIDRFIYAKLDEAGLKPSQLASKATLIRRAYYDLIGLPPTPTEVRAFVKDRSSGSYEAMLDYLLASPHYGEKWGRHWLDVVRYAETNGYERDSKKPHMWRYRDYVIDAFNDDMPYDQFIVEQLAGDEMDEVTESRLVATGYYRLGIWDDEPVDKDQSLYDMLDGVIDTTGRAFLGMTIGCARCHAHKIDPISHEEYYQFLSFFNGMTNQKRQPEITSLLSSHEQAIYDQKVAERKERLNELEKATRALDEPLRAFLALDQPGNTKRPRREDLDRVMRIHGKDLVSDDVREAYEALRMDHRRLSDEEIPGRFATTVSEIDATGREGFVFIRGNPHVKGDPVEPGFFSVLNPPKAVIPEAKEGAKTSGRRRVAAEWIASGQNPLTARVMVNRIWQHHFGRGIVATTNDFGSAGLKPTHPELLDWLAAEFVESGWKIKAMHKRIMMSRAYRMSSAGNAEGLEKDPQNNLLWRFSMRRLTAEEIRDSILFVNGTLNTRVGGESFYPTLPQEALEMSSQPQNIWGKSSPEEERRRSLYIHVTRSILTPLLMDFDFADTDSSCPVRFVTTQPAQALNMLNSAFVNEQAAVLADRLRAEARGDARRQVRLALNLTTSREPTEEEIERGLRFIHELQEKDGISHELALNRFALLTLNLNEFIFLD